MASIAESNALLEVCVESPPEAQNALLSGASRIELCFNLKVGGMSPPTDLIRAVVETMNATVDRSSPVLPLQIMVRFSEPSFVYTASQLSQMVSYISQVKTLNHNMLSEQASEPHDRRQSFISGFVFGCLRPTSNASNPTTTGDQSAFPATELSLLPVETEIDLQQVELLVQASRPHSTTFHRAFDEIHDKQRALLELRKLGVDRLLTSGGIGSVDAHMESLRSLIASSGSKQPLTALLSNEDLEQPPTAAIDDSTSSSTSAPLLGPGSETLLKPIIVMPGGGVRSHNARKLLDLGAQELHSSTPFFISRVE